VIGVTGTKRREDMIARVAMKTETGQKKGHLLVCHSRKKSNMNADIGGRA
jgi:hypothetical protein